MKNSKKYRQGRAPERGSALVYILIAIALLAALTFTFMEPSSQQTSSQNTMRTATQLQGQIDTIRSAIQECILRYPKGDTNIPTGGGDDDEGALHYFPINPDSTYYATATPGRSGDRLARNIRCPGNNPGGASVDDHVKVFTGSSGKFLPQASGLFSDWEYYNGNDGVFFWTETSKTDAFIATSLEKLDDNFSECEADVIDTADAPAGAKDLDSDTTITCPANNLCFRIWMIMDDTTAQFTGDADGDEAACSSGD